MLAETELCKGMMLLSALKVDSEDPDERRSDVSAAKAHLTSSGWFVQKNAIQLHGGCGVSQDTLLAEAYSALRTLRLADGPDEVHMRTIARWELIKSRL